MSRRRETTYRLSIKDEHSGTDDGKRRTVTKTVDISREDDDAPRKLVDVI
jgi:hypothetical protein